MDADVHISRSISMWKHENLTNLFNLWTIEFSFSSNNWSIIVGFVIYKIFVITICQNNSHLTPMTHRIFITRSNLQIPLKVLYMY